MRDWHRFCRAKELEVDDNTVRVRFPNGRTQQVRVELTPDGYRLVSTVMRSNAVETFIASACVDGERDLSLRILQCNRAAPLVGFRWSRDNRILAETHVPTAGLSNDEFELYLRRVAQEADRLEHLLTGQDRN